MPHEHEPASATPTIHLIFDGLFFFCFDDDKGCQVGVHTLAPRHQLTVTATETVVVRHGVIDECSLNR